MSQYDSIYGDNVYDDSDFDSDFDDSDDLGASAGGRGRKAVGGTARWIAEVKAVQKKMGGTYRDALIAASALRKQKKSAKGKAATTPRGRTPAAATSRGRTPSASKRAGSKGKRAGSKGKRAGSKGKRV